MTIANRFKEEGIASFLRILKIDTVLYLGTALAFVASMFSFLLLVLVECVQLCSSRFKQP